MGKLKRMSEHEARSILEHNGFRLVRQKGSHMVLQRLRPEGGTITVPIPDHSELRTGTLLGIIEQSGLPRSLFEVGG